MIIFTVLHVCLLSIAWCQRYFENYRKNISYQGRAQGGSPSPLFEPWNPHHSIRNFVLPQKYIKNFAVAQKLWILRPFFKNFSLREQNLLQCSWKMENAAKRLRTFSFSPPPFSDAGPGPVSSRLVFSVLGTIEKSLQIHSRLISNPADGSQEKILIWNIITFIKTKNIYHNIYEVVLRSIQHTFIFILKHRFNEMNDLWSTFLLFWISLINMS